MKTVPTLALALLLAAGAPALAAAPDSQPTASGGEHASGIEHQDKQFLENTARTNQGEIKVAQLAKKDAHSKAVKAFARLMIDDHTAIEHHLDQLTSRFNMKLPSGIAEGDKNLIEKLHGTSGAEFDRAFMQAQVKGHKKVVGAFRDEKKSAQNEQVKQFVEHTLPTLEQHLALAEAVQGSLGSEKTASNHAGAASGSSSHR